jgi:hypothetical protein
MRVDKKPQWHRQRTMVVNMSGTSMNLSKRTAVMKQE